MPVKPYKAAYNSKKIKVVMKIIIIFINLPLFIYVFFK